MFVSVVLVTLAIIALFGVTAWAIPTNDGAKTASDQLPKDPKPVTGLTRVMKELIRAHRQHMAFLERPCPETDEELALFLPAKFSICPVCGKALEFDFQEAIARSTNRRTFLSLYGPAMARHHQLHPECERAMEKVTTPALAEHMQSCMESLRKQETQEACGECGTDLFSVAGDGDKVTKLCARCGWFSESNPSETARAAAEKDIHARRKCLLETYFIHAPHQTPDWLLDALNSCSEPVNRQEGDPELPATYMDLVAEVRKRMASGPADRQDSSIQAGARGSLLAKIEALKPKALALPDFEALLVVHSAGREDQVDMLMTDERFGFVQGLGALYNANGESPSAIFLASKAWASNSDTGVQPSDDPNRVDAAIVSVLTSGGTGLSAFYESGVWETVGGTARHLPLLRAFWAGVSGKPIYKPVRLFRVRWHGEPPWPPSTSNPEFFRGLARLPTKDLTLIAQNQDPARWARLSVRQRRKELKALRSAFMAEANRLSDL